MSLEIRKMKADDLDQVMTIEQASFPFPWSRTSFEKELKDNGYAYYIVACTANGGAVVGYGGSWVLFGEAHITTLAVHPDYRRKGTGSILLKSLMDVSIKLGACQVFLEVRNSNDAARTLYEKFGFKIKGIRKKYYLDEDALIMARDFDPAEL